MSEETDKLIEKMTRKAPILPDADLLSSGSTLLNLACSGRVSGAFAKGTYIHFVGGSRSGKTLISYNTLAEAAANPIFDNYRLIYDNVEKRDFWDHEKFWGKKLAARIEPPGGTRENPIYSQTVQDFYFLLWKAWKRGGKPFIWIADSMASLDEVSKQELFEENLKLDEKGKDLKGSYGMMAKAKVNSDNILWVVNALEETGSILVIINQERDNIGFGAQFNPNTVGGGRSLKFYACHEIWAKTIGEITRTVHGKARQIGTTCQLKIKKNSINGRDRTVEVPIYHSIGMDDLGSCVDFLMEEEHWKKSGASIDAPEFDFSGPREKLIHLVEKDELESELRKLVQKVWDEIEAECEVERKPRYQ